MGCYLKRLIVVTLFAIMLSLSAAYGAVQILGPANGQTVRETVNIVIPERDIPDGGFVSLFISDSDKMGYDNFVAALDPGKAEKKAGKLIFKWNSKEPYRREADQKLDRYWADGTYIIVVQVHNRESKMIGSAAVKVALRNKVARSVPAPAIRLINNMPMGQTNLYVMTAEVQAYDSTDLPILGNMGLSAVCVMNESVDDIWPDGSRLVHYKAGRDTQVYTFGTQTLSYSENENRPHLYRLMDVRGNVVNGNVFPRQKGTSLSGIQQVLPGKAVKQGDSWSDTIEFKVEGVTAEPITFRGTAVLDSFEWEQGEPCAKIVSKGMKATGQISLLNGQIYSRSEKITAKSTTWFAYKKGKIMRRHIVVEFPAEISRSISSNQGLGTVSASGGYGGETRGGPGGVISRYGGMTPDSPDMQPSYGAGGVDPLSSRAAGGGGMMPGMRGSNMQPGMMPGGGGMIPGMRGSNMQPGMMPGGGGMIPGMRDSNMQPGMMPGGGGMIPGMRGSNMQPGMMPGGGGMIPGMRGSNMQPGYGGGGVDPLSSRAAGAGRMGSPGYAGAGGGGMRPSMRGSNMQPGTMQGMGAQGGLVTTDGSVQIIATIIPAKQRRVAL